MCFRRRTTSAVCSGNDESMKLLALVVFSVFTVLSSADDSFQDVLNVKPGPEDVFEKELNGYKCKFAYQAQGGTNEQWQVGMEILDDGGAFLCSVARGQASYLYFQKFHMSVSGPNVKLEQTEAISSGATPLDPEEYQIDKTANSVSHVEGKFKNHLERVTVYATIGGKREL
ncbi:hypothetical protein BaRGS_00029048 [Batillaria attramentaria]|uniref:Myeloid-derived growth factor n=1 Tax=Batillaria attramentaria TaxID=370345 RepID=A0ABD0JY93_9CAEN